MRTLDFRGRDLTGSALRAEVDIDVATHRVEPILADVRERGAQALADYAEKFDGVRPPTLRVPADALHRAAEGLDDDVRAALAEAIRRARLGHEAQLPTE